MDDEFFYGTPISVILLHSSGRIVWSRFDISRMIEEAELLFDGNTSTTQ
jgi:hypothetical protein